jgi:UDP-glucuronate decarboxylase
MLPNDGRVVSNFIMQALRGKDVTVYGDGRQTRSFCYVSDLTDALVKLMNSPDDFQGPVNLGNPDECTILDLARQVFELSGSKPKIVFKPLPPDDPMQRQPDITLAKKKLKWKPTIALEEGLKKTFEYFENLIKGKV